MLISGDGVKKEIYRRGETVFMEGDPGHAAFVVESGRVGISKTVDGETVRLAVLKGGELFGEMAILDGSPRMATATALEDSILVKIPADVFETKLDRSDNFMRALMKIFLNNLRNVHKAYTKRSRSIEDYNNALAYHLRGYRSFMDHAEPVEFRHEGFAKLDELDAALAELREICEDYESRKSAVIEDRED